MLYRVLVVDDEEMITDSLAGMLEESDRYELDVYKAYSGKEALRLLDEFQVDIVVSDICMPGITGIELAGQIRKKWPMCHVIFQTGYDEFWYAQQAIRQRVTHYILKSEGDEVLLEAIGECISSIEREADAQTALIRVQEENRRYKQMLHRDLMCSLLNVGEGSRQAELLKWEENVLTVDLKKPMMMLAARSVQEMNEEQSFQVEQALREKIAYAVKSEGIWMDQHVLIWVLQPKEEETLQHAQAVIKGMAEGFCGTIWRTLGISIAFVFQENEILLQEMKQAFEELQQIALHRLDGKSQITMAGVEYFREAENETEKSFINKLMSYLAEHIDGDLSLCTLSDKLHLNASYLSRRFKELTGRTLTEVILELRMEKACNLLRQTSLRTSEIALAVGYETTASFCKVFKKTMKMTPQTYRSGKEN